ncbi:MAG: 50S ribosomal protein L11 [Candidatus Methylarchaceae archaeon HK01B]|nr:50S ribosomal protein L11 [Candidatus Methylarchaceae archaeon HK01M]MCP8312649.1 50S ribosomal protein L11 [Candidatus Methylarchaceae archaeon HK02M1]MCP8318277.1 50S ribosomal protein L11 [Candidatus Methylarchaceae archaeon HK01B]
MGEKKVVNALIVGGKATAGPPLGPALGPYGVNVLVIVNKINETTKDYSGMRVPVKITVDLDTKEFDLEVGVPTTAALVVKEAGIQKGSGTPNKDFVGNLSFQQVIDIAKAKKEQSYSKDLKSLIREVVGTCISMGVSVEERDPREIQKEISEGKWDKALEG